jgi:hypothetical protein
MLYEVPLSSGIVMLCAIDMGERISAEFEVPQVIVIRVFHPN